MSELVREGGRKGGRKGGREGVGEEAETDFADAFCVMKDTELEKL